MRIFYFFILIGLAFTGCTDKKEPISTLHLGSTVWPGYEPLFLGQKKNIIDKKSIHLVEYISSSQTLRAFRRGQIDAAALTLYDALLLLSEGIGIKVVLVFDVSNGGDVIISQNRFLHFKDLYGKTIGLEKSTMGLHVLSKALKINDMKIGDVKIKKFEGYEHERAFEKRELDAIVTYEPMRSRMLKEGANEVFSSKEMPNEIIDVLIIRDEYLNKHPKQIKKLIVDWYRTLEYYKANIVESNTFFAKRLKLDPKDVNGSFDTLILPSKEENIKLLNEGETPFLLKVSANIEGLMFADRLIDKELPIDSLLDYDLSKLYDIK